MPKLNMSVPHSLGQEEAAKRLRTLIEKIKHRHGEKASNVTESWEGDTLNFGFTTYGFKIKGTMAVEPEQVVVNTDLPFAAMMFKGKIEQETRDTLDKALA